MKIKHKNNSKVTNPSKGGGDWDEFSYKIGLTVYLCNATCKIAVFAVDAHKNEWKFGIFSAYYHYLFCEINIKISALIRVDP